MDLKLLALTACVLIGGSCAQDNQSIYTGSTGVGSNQNSTELGSLPGLGVSLQKHIDDASGGSSIRIPLNSYVLSGPLHITKNMTLVGSPFAYIDAQGASQILQIDNPKASVAMENFLFMHGSGDYGGAIASQAKSSIIRDCRFLDSSANYGAAIYQKGGNLQVTDSTFEGNNATIWSAAIYDNSGDMQVEPSKFTQNPGSHVIYINSNQPNKANVLIMDYNVSNNPGPYNSLGSGFSGAIVCENSTSLIDRCIIKGNRALIMTPTFLGGITAGLRFGGSDVTLNDTLIEGNEALYAPAISIGRGCNVMMNRYTITGNRALSVLYKGEQVDGDVAGISITVGSTVTMDGVSISNNQVEGDFAAIGNAGILSLKNVRIYGNSAGNTSSIRNSRYGRLIFGKNVQIYGNKAPHDVYSEGPVEMDFD
jgi:hypothetical protein